VNAAPGGAHCCASYFGGRLHLRSKDAVAHANADACSAGEVQRLALHTAVQADMVAAHICRATEKADDGSAECMQRGAVNTAVQASMPCAASSRPHLRSQSAFAWAKADTLSAAQMQRGTVHTAVQAGMVAAHVCRAEKQLRGQRQTRSVLH
jgi:hypothetical protein